MMDKMDKNEVPVQVVASKNGIGSGLKEAIAKAKTKSEVETALLKGTTFKGASPDTVRKWDKIARRRLDQIAQSPSVS